MTCITCKGTGTILMAADHTEKPCPHCTTQGYPALDEPSPDRPKVLRYEIPERAGKSVGVTVFNGRMIIACEFAAFALDADGAVEEIMTVAGHGS